MSALLLVVLALVFAALVLGTQGVFLWLAMKREEEESRVRRRLGLDYDDKKEDDENVSDIIRDQAADAAMAFLGEYGEQLSTTLRAAASEMTVTQLVQQMAMIGVVLSLVGMIMLGPAGILGFPLGMYIPYARLQAAANTRAELLLKQLPDALEMMSRAMQTGTGLSEAFRLASEEMPEPLSIEFGRIYEEVRFGKDWREVLNALVERNPTIFDLRLFVSTLLLQKDTGGNMIETLSNIAKTIRNRYVFDAKVRAMTSEARASGTVLAGMPLGVIVLVLVASPGYLTPLYATSPGNMVIILGLCLYSFGMYAMKIAAQVEA